jgi:uncharacterized membrane protein (UPF0182 family)
MYVKTLFLVSRQTGIKPLPELKLVVLAYSNRIVFAESYDRALQLLTSQKRPQASESTDAQPMEGALSVEDAQRALRLMDNGRKALGEGDWEEYGRTQRELEALLRKAAMAPGAESGQ